jgi:hypothetical protein
MVKLSNLEENYIPVKKYSHKEGGELIGILKDSRNFQYVGNAVDSFGEIYYRNSVSPFAKMKATLKKEGDYEFTLFVKSKKLSSTELKEFNALSLKAIKRIEKPNKFLKILYPK